MKEFTPWSEERLQKWLTYHLKTVYRVADGHKSDPIPFLVVGNGPGQRFGTVFLPQLPNFSNSLERQKFLHQLGQTFAQGEFKITIATLFVLSLCQIRRIVEPMEGLPHAKQEGVTTERMIVTSLTCDGWKSFLTIGVKKVGPEELFFLEPMDPTQITICPPGGNHVSDLLLESFWQGFIGVLESHS